MNPDGPAVIEYDEPTLLPPSDEMRLEKIFGRFPEVTTTPTWVPKTFRESIAVNSTSAKLYYYASNAWKVIGAPTQFITTQTAGEALTAGDAVIAGAQPTSASISVASDGADRNLTSDDPLTGNNLWAQTFTATKAYLYKVQCKVSVGGTGSWLFTVSLQTTSGGAPTGTEISRATYTYVEASGSSVNVVDFVFSTPAPITSGSVYALVMTVDNTTNVPTWRYSNGFGYAGGVGYKKLAGVWSTPDAGADDFYFIAYESGSIPNKVFKAKATNNDDLANNFIGFANATVAAAASVDIVCGGVMTGLSGLTPGAIYYISNTAGAIASSAGSQSRKIGVALSATTLLIRLDNP